MRVDVQIGRRRYRSKLKQHLTFPSLLALIDLCFLLLMFMLMASSIVRISGIEVKLPAVDAPYVAHLGNLVISVTGGDNVKIYFRDRECDLNFLRRELAVLKDPDSKMVVIRAAHDVPAGVVEEIMAIAAEARLTSLLAVRPVENKPEIRFE